MNKEEWIWVAIRIFGIYLIVLAIINIPEAISNIYLMSNLSMDDGTVHGTKETIEFVRSMAQAAESKAISSTLKFIIFTVIGIYFLRGGRILHAIVVKQ